MLKEWMLKFLDRDRLPAILVLCAVAIFLFSFFDITFSPLTITPRTSAPIFPLAGGAVLMCVGLFMLWRGVGVKGMSLTSPFSSDFDAAIPVLPVRFGAVEADVVFGKIEVEAARGSVVLPMSEFFDTDCLEDRKSATGAYVTANYASHIENIRGKLIEALSTLPTKSVAKSVDVVADSFGVGITIPVNLNATSSDILFFSSVSCQRRERSIYSLEEFIFQSIRSINEQCNKLRVQEITVPLLGAGHGGMTPRRSLIILLMAIASISACTHLRKIKIVIYKNDEGGSDISREEVELIVGAARWLQTHRRA